MRNVLLFVLAIFGGVGAGYVAKRFLPGQKPDIPVAVVAEVVEPVNVPPHPTQQAAKADPIPSHYKPDGTPGAPLYLRGYMVRGNRFNAVLSDGRTLTERDGHLCDPPRVRCGNKCAPLVESIERNGLLMKDGTFYAFRSTSHGRAELSSSSKQVFPEPEAKTSSSSDSVRKVYTGERWEPLFDGQPISQPKQT